MSLPITVFTGLPGSGKSTSLVTRVNEAIAAGRPTATFACSDSPILQSRPNLHRGRSGSRTPNLFMPLTHFVSLAECVEVLSSMEPGSLVGFDEAQYFGEALAPHLIEAAERGVEVLIATPSPAQLTILQRQGVKPVELTMPCDLCLRLPAAVAVRLPAKDGTVAVCDRCRGHLVETARLEVLARLQAQAPHPGERSLYQPVELPECKKWDVIRPDSERRADIVARLAVDAMAGRDPWGAAPTYLDIGCNTGYLCHLMSRRGFHATGVDVVKDDLVVAQLLDAYFRRDGTIFVHADAHDYLRETRDVLFDVTSAFSVFQWVMIQKSPQHGIECIEWLIEKTREVCVLEMGDSCEAHYRDRIGMDIGTAWTCNLLERTGAFAEVRVIEATRHELKRDLVIGIKSGGESETTALRRELTSAVNEP